MSQQTPDWLNTGLLPWQSETGILTNEDFASVISNLHQRVYQIQNQSPSDSPPGISDLSSWRITLPITTQNEVDIILEEISFKSSEQAIKLYLMSFAFGSRVRFDTTLKCFVAWSGHSWKFYKEAESETQLLRILGKSWRPFYIHNVNALKDAKNDASRSDPARRKIKELLKILEKKKVKHDWGVTKHHDDTLAAGLKTLVDNVPHSVWDKVTHVQPFDDGCLYNVSQPGMFAPGIITDCVTGSFGHNFIEDLESFAA
eukprot:224556_1